MSKKDDENRYLFHGGELGKILEIRAEEDTKQTGIVEAYLTQWNTVDSWNTSFKKGAFKKSFKTRGISGTRLIWNHSQLAGKILELREDTYGPLVKVQFNLNTMAGKEAYEHVRAKDVNCFSFGFITLKDQWNGQVREITEVDMLECGPVIFEANSQAKIVDIRSGVHSDGSKPVEYHRVTGKAENRSTDFDETQKQRELNAKGWQLLSSLEWTIDDIYYGSNATPAEVISLVDTAIAKFHTAYITWLNEYYEQFETREGKTQGSKNPCEFRNALQVTINALDKEDLVKRSALTQEEVETMAKGKLLPLDKRSKIAEADKSLAEAFSKTRSSYIESLCDELRSGSLAKGEIDRIDALLASNRSKNEIQVALDVLKDFRSKL